MGQLRNLLNNQGKPKEIEKADTKISIVKFNKLSDLEIQNGIITDKRVRMGNSQGR